MAGGSLLEEMLEAAVRNGGLKSGSARGGQSGGLGDILGQVLGGQPSGAGGRTQPGGGGLGDILGQVLTGQQGRPGGGGLGDILGTVLGGGQPGSGQSGRGAGSSGGGTLGDRFREQDIRVEGAARQGETRRSREDDDIEVTPRQSERRPTQTRRETPAEPTPQSAGRTGIEIPEQLKRYGGIAILSILAWKVLQSYQKKPGASDSGQASPAGFDPKNVPGGAEALQNTLVDAMIAATQADGVVDKAEQQQLLGQLDKLGVDAGERDNLAKRLGTPVDVGGIVKMATTPEIAVQIYAASALAISADTPKERQFLDNLAQSMKLDPALKAQIEQTIGKG